MVNYRLDIMSTLLTLILGILAAAVSKVLADEFKEWTPWIVNRLIRFSTQRIPEVRKKELEEQWRNRVANRPGFIAKLIDALTCVAASLKLAPPKLRVGGILIYLLITIGILSDSLGVKYPWLKICFRVCLLLYIIQFFFMKDPQNDGAIIQGTDLGG